jgi:thioredoxin-related protein
MSAPSTPVQGPVLPSVAWNTLDQAWKTAKTRKKAIFVMVYADWCGYCHKMEATTFRDPEVVEKLNSGFVVAKLNGESGRPFQLDNAKWTENQWAVRQGVQGFPALIVLDAKGRTIVHYPGYMTSAQASHFLSDIGEFLRQGGIDKKGDFLDWSEKRG